MWKTADSVRSCAIRCHDLTELMLMTEKEDEHILCIRVMTSKYHGETYNNCFAFGDIWGSLAHFTTTEIVHAITTFETMQIFRSLKYQNPFPKHICHKKNLSFSSSAFWMTLTDMYNIWPLFGIMWVVFVFDFLFCLQLI